ncbi:MAG: FtsX-like permease family protein [Candidatus Treponema excrementipullorum]|nr:FtsX-like permease family protein [Candidatus Treponema excrementipullorum]
MIFKLALKNILARKSSVVIVLFMTLVATLLIVANAVFDSTEKGVESSFVQSFTGDFIIRPISDVPLSLFGDETPVTGELTEIERLSPYEDILQVLSENPAIKKFTPQITGISLLEFGDYREPMSIFGVNADAYLDIMSGVTVEEGKPYKMGDKGIMISRQQQELLGAAVGDTIQFTIVDGVSFRIRAVPVTGIYSYQNYNTIFDRFVLINPETVRDIMDITDTVSSGIEIDESKTSLLDGDLNFDDLFFTSDEEGAVFEDSQDSLLETEEVIAENPVSDSTSWHFLICDVKDSEDVASVMRSLNRTFKKNGWPVEAVNWRHAAGSTALYLYWMRIIFNIGILIIVVAGFIMVNNTLVVSVLNRSREIGTMRALGATRSFVALNCMIENLILAFISGFCGCLLGVVVTRAITKAEITFTNDFLIQLFGGEALVTAVTASNMLWIMFLMFYLGILGWIYPVITTLKVQPIEAIQGTK